MNASHLLLMPLAAVALVSSAPSQAPSDEFSQVASVLDRPEFRSLIEQLRQAVGPIELPDRMNESGHQVRAQNHEQGLHTSHLSAPGGYFSAARGLTPQSEWEQMFPRYALKLAPAR
jgi:hypothetical protein